MRCACVDIGSNTTRLLVADVGEAGLREVLCAKAYTRLDTLPDTVAAQVAAARSHGAERLRVVATAGVRGAPGQAAAIEARAGVPVDVLAGEEEAALAFAGAVRCHPGPLRGTVAVVDVGGGSTEIAVGDTGGGVAWSASVPVGSRDPSGLGRVSALRPPPVDAALAVGGSATSTARLVGPSIDRVTADRALAALAAGEHDLDPVRAGLLPGGLAILVAVSELLGRPLEICGGGLREGVVTELARFTSRG